MGMVMFIGAATVCLFVLRSAWRMLVEIPDIDQVWAPDAVDGFLSRWISACLTAGCGLFLVVMVPTLG